MASYCLEKPEGLTPFFLLRQRETGGVTYN